MSTLAEGARTFGLDLTAVQLEQFESYYRHLVEWNARVNLTAITGYDQVQVLHFLDSLSIVTALPRGQLERRKLIDVGSGAGFPGLPLAIALPELQVTLLEATGKKVLFLDMLVCTLGLANVSVLRGRAEELGQDPAHREQYDFATARAVAQLRILVEYALPLLRIGGAFAASKSAAVEEEIAEAGRGLEVLGGRVKQVIPVVLPTLDEPRQIVMIEKVRATPDKYPRRPGMPEKRPL